VAVLVTRGGVLRGLPVLLAASAETRAGKVPGTVTWRLWTSKVEEAFPGAEARIDLPTTAPGIVGRQVAM